MQKIDYSARTVIVAFRASRAFKLIGKWDALTNTLAFLWESIEDIFYVSLLLVIFIFIFAFIGMELFANELKINSNDEIDLENGLSMRVNFDSIGYALIAVFTAQISDCWSVYHFQYTRVSKAAIAYFPICLLIFNIIIMNLFVAVMLEKFFSDDQKQAQADEERRNEEFIEKQKKIAEKSGTKVYKHRVKTLLMALKTYNVVLSLDAQCKEKKGKTVESYVTGISLNCFDEKSDFRLFIYTIIKHWAFAVTVYLCVFANSLAITVFTPLRDPKSGLYVAARVVDITTTCLLGFEIFAKIVVYGLVSNGPKSFLRSYFNVFDLLSTLATITAYIYGYDEGPFAKILFLLRTLRVLRMVNLNKGCRRRCKAIIAGFKNIGETILIATLLIMVFGFIGVHLFKQRYNYCLPVNNESTDNIDTIYDCLNLGREWADQDIGFNSILHSCLTLFEMFTSKSWYVTLAFAQDAYEIDYEPRRNVYPYKLWFFVCHMVVSFIFMKALLFGVISNTFIYQNELQQGLRNLTFAQRKWVSLSKIIFKAAPVKYYREDCRFYNLYLFLNHPAYNYFMDTAYVLNVVILCLSWYRASEQLNYFINVCYIIFEVLFVLEGIMKLVFYGRDYFDSGWNIYDLSTILIVIIMHIITAATESRVADILFTISWIFNVITLFNKVIMLKKIFQIFVLSLPSMINLAILLFIIIYIFSVVGISLFSGVKLQSNLNVYAHFQDIITAFITVYRIATYDGWVDIMHDAMRMRNSYFDCVYDPTFADTMAHGGQAIGCGMLYAPIYFVIFILVVPFLFLNVFISIMVSSVTEITSLDESVLSDQRLIEFLDAWKKHDPKASGYVKYEKIWDLLYDIPMPLGANEKEMNNKYYCAVILWMLQLKLYSHKSNYHHYVAFYDVLEALVKKCIYRPQTLDKIYNNQSKEALIEGLGELWDQRTQLAMDKEEYTRKIEDLKHYYDAKASQESTEYKPIKIKLPNLVWIILRIAKILKSRIKAKAPIPQRRESDIEKFSLPSESPKPRKHEESGIASPRIIVEKKKFERAIPIKKISNKHIIPLDLPEIIEEQKKHEPKPKPNSLLVPPLDLRSFQIKEKFKSVIENDNENSQNVQRKLDFNERQETIEHKTYHNEPLPSNKIKKKVRLDIKKPKHNIPTEIPQGHTKEELEHSRNFLDVSDAKSFARNMPEDKIFTRDVFSKK